MSELKSFPSTIETHFMLERETNWKTWFHLTQECPSVCWAGVCPRITRSWSLHSPTPRSMSRSMWRSWTSSRSTTRSSPSQWVCTSGNKLLLWCNEMHYLLCVVIFIKKINFLLLLAPLGAQGYFFLSVHIKMCFLYISSLLRLSVEPNPLGLVAQIIKKHLFPLSMSASSGKRVGLWQRRILSPGSGIPCHWSSWTWSGHQTFLFTISRASTVPRCSID